MHEPSLRRTRSRVEQFSTSRSESRRGEPSNRDFTTIAPLVTRVVYSHPQSNTWIAKDADKCDRIDAYKLAELLRLNRFKDVRYPQEQRRREFKIVGAAL